MAEVWDPFSEEGRWNPRFLRPFNDWEVDLVDQFLSTIQRKRVFMDLEDKLLWKETKNGKFSIKSLMVLWR